MFYCRAVGCESGGEGKYLMASDTAPTSLSCEVYRQRERERKAKEEGMSHFMYMCVSVCVEQQRRKSKRQKHMASIPSSTLLSPSSLHTLKVTKYSQQIPSGRISVGIRCKNPHSPQTAPPKGEKAKGANANPDSVATMLFSVALRRPGRAKRPAFRLNHSIWSVLGSLARIEAIG